MRRYNAKAPIEVKLELRHIQVIIFVAFFSFNCLAENLLRSHEIVGDFHNVVVESATENISGSVSSNFWSVYYSRIQSLDENLFLIWAPFPLGVGFRTIYEDNSWTASKWFLSFKLDGNGSVLFGPQYTGQKMARLSEDLAFETRLSYGCNIPMDNQLWRWVAELSAGPRFQFSSKWFGSTYLMTSGSNRFFSGYHDWQSVTTSKPFWETGLSLNLEKQANETIFIHGEYRMVYVDPLWKWDEIIKVSVEFLF